MIAGWTYSRGKYRVPPPTTESRSKCRIDFVEVIYNYFDLDSCTSYSGEPDAKQHSAELRVDAFAVEFENSDELVAYLDEYCLPHYTLKQSDVQAQHLALLARSETYKYLNLQSRYDLLGVVFNEMGFMRHRVKMGVAPVVRANGLLDKQKNTSKGCATFLRRMRRTMPFGEPTQP